MLKFAAIELPRCWLAAIAIAMLAGCASLQPPPSVEGDKLQFELQGRIALKYGEEGGNARIEWRHGEASDDLLIANSLGQGIARISRRGGNVQLLTADNKEYHATDAEELTQQVLGWRLPLAGLPFWVRAKAVDGRPARLQSDPSGRPAAIEQDGWRIEYLAWNGDLPSRINFAHPGGNGAVPIEIRLVVDRWNPT
jgi:outer membrane lipoprotein LolB